MELALVFTEQNSSITIPLSLIVIFCAIFEFYTKQNGLVHTDAITESAGVPQVREELSPAYVVEQHVDAAIIVRPPPSAKQKEHQRYVDTSNLGRYLGGIVNTIYYLILTNVHILQMRKSVCLLRFYALATQPTILKFCIHVVRGSEKDVLTKVIFINITVFHHSADGTAGRG